MPYSKACAEIPSSVLRKVVSASFPGDEQNTFGHQAIILENALPRESSRYRCLETSHLLVGPQLLTGVFEWCHVA